jgi:hypothetical protein
VLLLSLGLSYTSFHSPSVHVHPTNQKIMSLCTNLRAAYNGEDRPSDIATRPAGGLPRRRPQSQLSRHPHPHSHSRPRSAPRAPDCYKHAERSLSPPPAYSPNPPSVDGEEQRASDADDEEDDEPRAHAIPTTEKYIAPHGHSPPPPAPYQYSRHRHRHRPMTQHEHELEVRERELQRREAALRQRAMHYANNQRRQRSRSHHSHRAAEPLRSHVSNPSPLPAASTISESYVPEGDSADEEGWGLPWGHDAVVAAHRRMDRLERRSRFAGFSGGGGGC